jgi:DNA-directed RNA polymerase subunit RPC12/RpoP
MICTIDNLVEQINKFNSLIKYLCRCEHCNHQILFSKDEIRDGIVKCPYCGHWEKIHDYELDYKEYDLKLRAKIGSEFNSEVFNV